MLMTQWERDEQLESDDCKSYAPMKASDASVEDAQGLGDSEHE